jgi:GNAT superfamily N-acetyltransferase
MTAIHPLAPDTAAEWRALWRGYLEDLFVSPGSRGAGAGRKLISHVRQWASEHDCAKVCWLTRDDNATARELYDRVAEASGFVQYQIRLSGTRVSARGASS